MSKIAKNFEEFIQNLNDELDAVSQKYPNGEGENYDCGLEKLKIFTRYTTALINSRSYSDDNVRTESTPNRFMCADGNAKIQNDLNAVRNGLDRSNQVEEQAVESLLKGIDSKNSPPSPQFEFKKLP